MDIKITPADKKMFADYAKKYEHTKHWKLGDMYEIPVRLKNPMTNRLRKEIVTVKPVNGETNFNDVGLSHGIIHFQYNGKAGHAGIHWFFNNAKKLN